MTQPNNTPESWEEDKIRFIEWINHLSPWNIWIDRYDHSKGMHLHVNKFIDDFLSTQRQKIDAEWRDRIQEAVGRKDCDFVAEIRIALLSDNHQKNDQ